MPATITRHTLFTGRNLAAMQAELDAALARWHRKWLPPSADAPMVQTLANAHEAGTGAVQVDGAEMHADCRVGRNDDDAAGGNEARGGAAGSGDPGKPACRVIAPWPALHRLLRMATACTGDHAPDASVQQPMGAFEGELVVQ